jgi:hypothetical protein
MPVRIGKTALIEKEERNMKLKSVLVGLGVLIAATVCVAAEANMGTWKLNEAKSKIAPGGAKNNTVVYSAAGDSIKVTVDGVDGDGKPAHNEWTGKFDGKDYAVTGDPTTDMRSYKRVDALTLALTTKKAGKVVATGTIVVAADGKSRTVSTTTTDAMGMKLSSVGVYDKQ